MRTRSTFLVVLAFVTAGAVAGASFGAKRRAVGTVKPRPPKMYRGDSSRSGVSEERGPATLTRTRWSRELDGPVRGVVFHEGVVYAGAAGGIYALTSSTGDELWSFRDSDLVFSPPAIDGDMVYTCARSRFFAIDRGTGVLSWSLTADSSVGSTAPLVSGGVAYVGSANGTIYAIDLRTRAGRWSVHLGGGVRTYLTASAGLLFATQNGGVLRAFDAANGDVVWTKTLAGGNDWNEVAADDELLFAGAGGNDLYALEARTGVVRWMHDDANSDRAAWSAPVVAEGVVYAGNQNRRMFAFDAATGRVLWRVDTGDAATSDPVLAGGVLYFGVGSHGAPDDGAPRDLYAVLAGTGTVVSTFRANGLVLAGCDVGDGALYVHTLARKLIAIE